MRWDIVRFFLIGLSLGLLGCTAATPDVSALGTIGSPFELQQNEVRVETMSDLSNVTLTARCLLSQSQFEIEFPDTTPPQTWSFVPTSTMTSPFVSVTNNCSSNQTLTMVLDLQSFADFSSIIGSIGAFRTIRFRDINITGLQFTDDVRVLFSSYSLRRERFIFGQGINNTICRSGKCLQGRVVNQDQNQNMISGSRSLRGRVVWQ